MIAVVTGPGFGKSTSFSRITKEDLLRGGIEHDHIGLEPSKTLLINVKGKPLPYRNWGKDYKEISMNEAPLNTNYLASTDYGEITKVLGFFNSEREDINSVVIDDFQYLIADEFMTNALKAGFEKFSKLAKNVYDLLTFIPKMRKNLNIYILTHVDETKDGSYKIKTAGKLLDEKVTLEGLFTMVFYGKGGYNSTTKKPSRLFVTNYDGEYPAKSPIGMFDSLYIPNDLGLVDRAIRDYYSI
jgi:hypothetical protein